LIDQVGGRHASPALIVARFLQEGFNVLLGRLDEQFPVRVAAHVCRGNQSLSPTCVVTVFVGESLSHVVEEIAQLRVDSPSASLFDLLVTKNHPRNE